MKRIIFLFVTLLLLQACTTENINGELNGEKLNYPIGTGNFMSLLNKPFDSAAFMNTPQFYFMGALDDNDAIPYEDGYSENERKVIYKLLGQEMMPSRWANCKRVCELENNNSSIKTYPETGHEQPARIKKELAEFFKQNID